MLMVLVVNAHANHASQADAALLRCDQKQALYGNDVFLLVYSFFSLLICISAYLALVCYWRRLPRPMNGKPEQTAAALLQELSKACSKEGGSKALEAERIESPVGGRGGGGGGGSSLVADARRATETAVTRYHESIMLLIARPKYDGMSDDTFHA